MHLSDDGRERDTDGGAEPGAGRDSSRDVLDALARLQHETSILATQLGTGEDPQASYHGHDPTGSVRLTVDGTGTVTAVELDPSWRKKIDPRALAAAVLSAYSFAGMDRFGAWAKAVSAASTQLLPALPEPANGTGHPGHPGHAEPADHPDDADPTSTMTVAEVLDLLDRADAEVADLERQVEQLAGQTTTWTGDGGKATVTMRGDQVVGLELEQERWAGIAHHREIAGEILDAFQRAAAGTANTGTGLLPAHGAVSRLNELVGDLDAPDARSGQPSLHDEPRGGHER